MNPKIKTQEEIVKIVKKLKKQGKKIVTCNGSFDILHFGHLQCLSEAKDQGDILIILLNSDRSIKMYKGLNRPIVRQEYRAAFLSAMEYVNYVVLFDDINPKRVLAEIKPDIYCTGDDWGKNCVEKKVIEENGGKVYVLRSKRPAGASTSDLIKKILDVYSRADVKAVFLDRDGTININRPGCVREISQFKFAPGAVSALKKLSKTDYKIIIVTNQSGIGRGYFKEKDLKKIHQWMLKKLREAGARIDKIYYCPHHPEDNCSCRKPKIEMFLRAVADFNINLSKSWFVGDDDKDVIAGREANIKTIKIGKRMPKNLKLEPNYYVKGLLEAANIIIKK